MGKLKELFNCEVYSRFDVSNPKSLCVCDYDKEHIYSDYDLIKVFEYFKIKNPYKFLNLLDIDNSLVINGKKAKNLNREECLMELTLNAAKDKEAYIIKFKNILALHIKYVDSLNFEPSNKRIITMNNKEYLNIYFQKKFLKDIKPNNKAKFPHIKKIIFNLCGNNKEYYDHFIKHTAFKIQNPSVQLPSHWVFIDDGGTGKTTFLANEIFEKIFEISLITQSDLESNYTHYINKKQYIFCEEIESFTNNKKLKALTGSKSFTIDEKYKAQFDVINYATFIIFSNDIKAIHIDSNDRRWNIVGGGIRLVSLDGTWEDSLFSSEAENEEFFNSMYENLETEIKSFYSYLLSLKVSKQEVYYVLNTQYKKTICKMSKHSYDEFIDEYIKTDLISIIKLCLPNDRGEFEKNYLIYNSQGDNKGYWLKSNALYYLYNQYCFKNGYRAITQGNFVQRVWSHKNIKQIFETSKLISQDSHKFQAIKLKTYSNENDEMNENIEVTNLN